jgi:Zn-dependent protease with chaperone function
MSVATLVLPLIAAVGIAGAVTSVHRALPPRLAARFVTVALLLVAFAALPTLVVMALAFLAHAPLVGLGFEWCARAVGLHGAVSAWFGVPAMAVLVWGTARTARLLRNQRRLRVGTLSPVFIASSDQPYAVTLPGRAGQIVMSTAMIELLDTRERAVVLAHEEAHARYRHDRYLLVAAIAAAALPPLRGIARRVNYSIERWADDAAAVVCGDRRLVACTLGKVALTSCPDGVSSFAGLGVAARMGALLEPPVPAPARRKLASLWAWVGVMGALSLYQLHHVEQLLTALCPH